MSTSSPRTRVFVLVSDHAHLKGFRHFAGPPPHPRRLGVFRLPLAVRRTRIMPLFPFPSFVVERTLRLRCRIGVRPQHSRVLVPGRSRLL